jgi:uncharacterized protein YyaL (SSP411 family)
MLDDYAFTAVACLDAYEATADLSYFNFARNIADAMIARFFDPSAGGFLDSERTEAERDLGVLGTVRKPFQDSPTPAGNSVAAIALLRLYGYTNHSDYHEKAAQTLSLLAGVAGQYGIFAATYGIAAVHYSRPHTQVLIVGDDENASQLYRVAASSFALGRTMLKISSNEAVAQNLPPALAETVPNLPGVKEGKSLAVICSNFTCQAPISDPQELERAIAGPIVAN